MEELLIQLCVSVTGVISVLVVFNVLSQVFWRNRHEPPVVFHWLPFIGNAVAYGTDPYAFFVSCRKKHGDVFTFVLFGHKITCYLGVEGNDFVLNGKSQHLNAEEIYGPITTPVFGTDVIYDCPNAKLMEQKKFIKFGLTQQALESYVPLIEREVVDYIDSAPVFGGSSGITDISSAMAEITIFTAGRTLQGEEVRQKLNTDFAALYHDLDGGFTPVNFILPRAPLPQNRRRDAAHAEMRAIYTDIIRKRRQTGEQGRSLDMIWNLMRCSYRDGRPVPDREIAHLMITLLMAGQHTSASASTWIMLHLAARPDVAEALYREQEDSLGGQDAGGRALPLSYADLNRLPLLRDVVRETLRVHSAIHSIMRKVKSPLRIPKTPYVVEAGKVLLASPLMSAMSEEHFQKAEEWDPYRWDKNATDAENGAEGQEAFSKGARSPYLPFGAGRHRCIGEKFAYVNLAVIIVTMVRRFKVRTPDGSGRVPPTDYSSMFSRPMQPSMLRWERR